MSNELSEQKNQKFMSIFIVILLGAVGSGFWELFLKDTLFYSLNFILSNANYLFNSIGDDLYSSVGRNNTNGLLFLPSLFFIIFLIVMTWVYPLILTWVYIKNKNDDIETQVAILVAEKKERNIIKIIVTFFLAVIVTILYSYMLIQGINTRKATTYIEQSLEILSPYVSDQEFKKLRSEFRQVDTLDKFKTIYYKINLLAYEYKIELPEYSPLLVENKFIKGKK